MPPASATTPESTTTPKRSSRARTAAKPPLRPKMNVPARLRTRISVGLKPCGTSIADKHVPISRCDTHPVPLSASPARGATVDDILAEIEPRYRDNLDQIEDSVLGAAGELELIHGG